MKTGNWKRVNPAYPFQSEGCRPGLPLRHPTIEDKGGRAKGRRGGLCPLKELVDVGRMGLEKFFAAGHGHSLDAVRESYRSLRPATQGGAEAVSHLDVPRLRNSSNKTDG